MVRFLILLLLTVGILHPQSAPWWTSEPLRIVHLITSGGSIDGIPAAEAASWKAGNAYSTEHLEVMEMRGGLDDQGFYFQSSASGKVRPDYLRAYVTEAHKRGIRVIVYFNVHWYSNAFGEKHPDWRQITESGKPVSGVYNNGTDFCLNTGYRDWCFNIVRELCGYGIDGIFYDGPIFRADTCYGPKCRAKYRAEFGGEMPSKRKRQGPDAKRLLDFQTRSLAEFLRDTNRVIKSISPNIAFYMNGGVRGANWATARLNRDIVEHQDLLGSEGGFISGDLTHVPMWKPGLTARLLETQAGGKPTVIFSAASHKPWTFSLLPEPELRLLYADTIANGAGVWMGITPFEMRQPEMQAVASMNQYMANNRGYYAGSQSAANLALVWSEVSANFYAGSPAQMIDIDRVPQRGAIGNVDAEFNGVAEALVRAHTPFDVIDDVTLERDPLQRYAAIFLPNVACMSAKTAERLTRYVEDGGNLFATFETSLYDETGVRRNDFALAKLFGVTDGRKIVGPTNWDFMKPEGKHWLLEGVPREMIASTTYHARVKPQGAESVARFTVPLKGRYDGIPDVSDEPAITVQRFGKGMVVYCAGDFGNQVAAVHLPEYLRIVANASRRLAPPPVEVENTPGSVEVVWRSQPQKGRRLLHLVNFTGEMTRPITKIAPLTDVRITLRDGSASKAYTLMNPRPLPLRKDAGGRTQVTLPRAAEYEVVVFEK